MSETITTTSSAESGIPANAATVTPKALQPYAKNCFSSSKNFFQCEASTIPSSSKVVSAEQVPITTPTQIGVHKVVDGWFIDCCNTDLVLNKCAEHVGYDDNCKKGGDYSLNYIEDPDTSGSGSASSSNGSISSGAIAGAVVGSVIGATFLALLAAALLWKRRKTQAAEAEKAAMLSNDNPPSYHENDLAAAAGAAAGKELPNEVTVAELPANEHHELPASSLLSPAPANTTPTELPATTPSNLPGHPPAHPE